MRRLRVALFSVGVLAAGALAVVPATSGNADAIDLVKIPGLQRPRVRGPGRRRDRSHQGAKCA